jgi:hypothetical protein
MRYWIQVTTGQRAKVREREIKLERRVWNQCDIVEIWRLVELPSAGRGKAWAFDVETLLCNGAGWLQTGSIPIDREWFKAYHVEDSQK